MHLSYFSATSGTLILCCLVDVAIAQEQESDLWHDVSASSPGATADFIMHPITEHKAKIMSDGFDTHAQEVFESPNSLSKRQNDEYFYHLGFSNGVYIYDIAVPKFNCRSRIRREDNIGTYLFTDGTISNNVTAGTLYQDLYALWTQDSTLQSARTHVLLNVDKAINSTTTLLIDHILDLSAAATQPARSHHLLSSNEMSIVLKSGSSATVVASVQIGTNCAAPETNPPLFIQGGALLAALLSTLQEMFTMLSAGEIFDRQQLKLIAFSAAFTWGRAEQLEVFYDDAVRQGNPLPNVTADEVLTAGSGLCAVDYPLLDLYKYAGSSQESGQC